MKTFDYSHISAFPSYQVGFELNLPSFVFSFFWILKNGHMHLLSPTRQECTAFMLRERFLRLTFLGIGTQLSFLF